MLHYSLFIHSAKMYWAIICQVLHKMPWIYEDEKVPVPGFKEFSMENMEMHS